jgi:hypothetical protein
MGTVHDYGVPQTETGFGEQPVVQDNSDHVSVEARCMEAWETRRRKSGLFACLCAGGVWALAVRCGAWTWNGRQGEGVESCVGAIGPGTDMFWGF